MRRFLILLFPIILIIVAFIVWWQKVSIISGQGQSVLSFMLTLLQLMGIILILDLAVIVIGQYYIRSLMPSRLLCSETPTDLSD